MKLPDFYEFDPLNILKEKMGIPRGNYGTLTVLVDPSRLTELELETLTSSIGLDISPDDLTVLPDGTLAYKNSRVLLYIRDVTIYEPRIHLANCTTLQEMREQKRFSRYVVSTNTNGMFRINIVENNIPRSELRKLSVCQNCLKFLGLGGFSSTWSKQKKTSYVSNFNIQDFFKVYPRSLHVSVPGYDSENSPTNIYSFDFTEISKKYRESVNWRCEKCGISLENPNWRKWLHVHHINGIKSDNSSSNLEAICIRCHSDEPKHEHIKRSKDYQDFQKAGL